MTKPDSKLTALIAQWRAQADDMERASPSEWEVEIRITRRKADELEALILKRQGESFSSPTGSIRARVLDVANRVQQFSNPPYDGNGLVIDCRSLTELLREAAAALSTLQDAIDPTWPDADLRHYTLLAHRSRQALEAADALSPPNPTSTETRQAFCGWARIGWRAKGCGAELRYESTANGLEHWRCPACGNPHWWPSAVGEGEAAALDASPLRVDELVERLDNVARILDRAPSFLAKGQYSRIYEAVYRGAVELRDLSARLKRRKREGAGPLDASQKLTCPRCNGTIDACSRCGGLAK